jgi:formate C-acetyltransferase
MILRAKTKARCFDFLFNEFTNLVAPWNREEIEGMKEEGFVFSGDDKTEMISMAEYWSGRAKTFRERVGYMFDDDRLWPYVQLGVVLPVWGDHEWTGAGAVLTSGRW